MFVNSGNCCKVRSVLRYCNKVRWKNYCSWENRVRFILQQVTKMGHTWQDTIQDWVCRSEHRLRTLTWMKNTTFSIFELWITLTLSPKLSLSLFSHSLFLLTVTLTLFHSDLTSVSLIGWPSSCTNQWHALIIELLTSIGWLEQPKTHCATHKHTVCTSTPRHVHTMHTHSHNLTTCCTLTCSPWGQFWNLNIYTVDIIYSACYSSQFIDAKNISYENNCAGKNLK